MADKTETTCKVCGSTKVEHVRDAEGAWLKKPVLKCPTGCDRKTPE